MRQGQAACSLCCCRFGLAASALCWLPVWACCKRAVLAAGLPRPLSRLCPACGPFPVRWSAEGGHSVRLLSPSSLQEELKLDVEALRSSPVRHMLVPFN